MRLIEQGSLLLGLLGSASALPQTSPGFSSAVATCSGSFTSISAQAWIDAADPGWNVGNTLDAVEKEGDWNNPPVVAKTFDDVKKAGFKSIRLPVTYAYHFTSGSPNWDVDPVWLQRVSDVVDQIIQRNLYVITNVHHDSWVWADVTVPGANITQIQEKFYRLWYQIGTKLACKSNLLAFEPINEPPGTTAEHAAQLNKLQEIFLKALQDTGGFNPKRVITLVGSREDSIMTSQYFVRPGSISNPWAIQYHYYSPYDYVFAAWGKTIWGSDADKQALEADIANIRNNFTDVPLIIGEWAVSPVATETAARWRYFDFFVRTARKYKTATILWDNGADFLNRATGTWRDQTAIDIYMKAKAGVVNSLPDSTTEQSAATQFTSAYIFHRYGTSVADQTLPYLFNGNTLKSITSKDGTLVSGKDYTVSGQSITYKSALLSKYLSPTTPTGSITNLTLTFSAGAPITANIVQWDVPTLSTTSRSAASLNGADLVIPLQWKGVNKPATVKALRTDGVYLQDDFTQWFGPLQSARITYEGGWNWDGSSVIITKSTVAAVVAARVNTVFTIEFYPRVPGNSVNFTLTV